MTAALAMGFATGHPITVLPLAVGSLYASANDRLYAGPRRIVHILVPILAGAVGMLAGLALRHGDVVVLTLIPAALGLCAGVISVVGPTASAAGLQLLAMTALGGGLPDRSGPWWLPASLLLAGAVLVAGLAAVHEFMMREGAAEDVLALRAEPQPPVRVRLVSGLPYGLRLSAAAVVAVFLAHVLHPARGYWLLLTVALVLSYGALTASIVPVVLALLRLVGVTGNGLLGWRLLDTAIGLAIAVLVGHDWSGRRPQDALV